MRRTLLILSLPFWVWACGEGANSDPGEPFNIIRFSAHLEMSQTSFDFGRTFADNPVDQTFTLKNSGTRTASELKEGTPSLANSFLFKGGSFPGEGGTCVKNGFLDVGDECTIVITFKPLEDGALTDTVRVSYHDGHTTQVVTVSVKGLGVLCNPDGTSFGHGTGSEGDPYLICTKSQLNSVRNYPTSSFKLMPGDFDLQNQPFEPIRNFDGTFDGNRQVISNLNVTATSGKNLFHFGLFAQVSVHGTIKNVEVKGGTVSGTVPGTGLIGGLVGKLSGGKISDSSYSGSVTANVTDAHDIGGLVGWLEGGTIERSFSTGTVTTTEGTMAGGLVGSASGGGTITDSYSWASVTAYNTAGGLIGWMENNVLVKSCYSTGEVKVLVSTSPQYGGLVGEAASGSTAVNCFWDTTTTKVSTGGVSGATGLPTDQMQLRSTFPWDFIAPVWKMPAGGGYPILFWQR